VMDHRIHATTGSGRNPLSASHPTKFRRFICAATIAAAWLGGSPASYSQVSTVYSYNSSNRIIQAIDSTGSGVQYQYDAAGNIVAVVAVGAQQLTAGTPDTVTLSTPGEAALLTFTLTNGQDDSLADSSITLSPAGSSVTVDVYNSAGTLVGSFNTGTASSINLSGLPAGTYSAIVEPASGVTGTLQLALNATGGSGGGTAAPIPIWSLVALGMGLFAIGRRAQQRQFV
jgi:YD repeat-containing protein